MADAPDPTPSSWQADEVAEVERAEHRSRLPLVLAVLAVVVVGLGAYVLVADPFAAQQDREWPRDVGGRPAGLGERGQLAQDVVPTDVAPGAYLWNDFDGWHLWFAFDESFPSASGTIVSGDDIEKVLVSPSGAGTATSDGDTIDFDVAGTEGVAGIDFEPGFFAERFEVTILGPDGEPIAPELVHRGAAMAPATVPVVVEKVAVDD